MRIWILLARVAMVVVTGGCRPSPSVAPPSGWIKLANSRFSVFVPPEMNSFGSLDPNAAFGELDGKSMHLSFEYGLSHEDLSGFKKAKHYAAHKELIGGKTARMVEFCYEPFRPYHELIAVDFPEANGGTSQLNVTVICQTTNDYETAKTIFRTIRFRQ